MCDAAYFLVRGDDKCWCSVSPTPVDAAKEAASVVDTEVITEPSVAPTTMEYGKLAFAGRFRHDVSCSTLFSRVWVRFRHVPWKR